MCSLFRELPTNQPAPADIKLIVTQQAHHRAAQRHLRPLPRQDVAGDHELRARRPLLRSLRPGGVRESPISIPMAATWARTTPTRSGGSAPASSPGKLDCIHCHTSSGRYRFKDPAKANDACLPCHAERVANAPAHTHHEAGTAGNECISCHMPMTEFARMRRSDHSMRPPTPATTLALQLPQRLQHLPHEQGRRVGRQARARMAQARLPEAGARARRPDRRGPQAGLEEAAGHPRLTSPARTVRKSRPSRWFACWPTARPTTSGRCCGT